MFQCLCGYVDYMQETIANGSENRYGKNPSFSPSLIHLFSYHSGRRLCILVHCTFQYQIGPDGYELVCVLFTAKYPFMNFLCGSGKVCGKLRMSDRYCMRHLVCWGWSAAAKYGNIRAVAVKWDSQSQSRSAGPDIDFAPSAQSQTQLFYSRPFSLEKSLSYKKVSRNVAFF